VTGVLSRRVAAASFDARRAALSQSVEAVIVNPAEVQAGGLILTESASDSVRGVRSLRDGLMMDEFGNTYSATLESVK